jgi:glyceraldehyde 3-phosphate dehydrogenase
LQKDVSVADVNAAMKAASNACLKGILEYTEDPIVSSDVIGNPASCIFDSSWTTEIGKRMIKVLGWYDNEYGYSNRTADIIARVAAL